MIFDLDCWGQANRHPKPRSANATQVEVGMNIPWFGKFEHVALQETLDGHMPRRYWADLSENYATQLRPRHISPAALKQKPSDAD